MGGVVSERAKNCYRVQFVNVAFGSTMTGMRLRALAINKPAILRPAAHFTHGYARTEAKVRSHRQKRVTAREQDRGQARPAWPALGHGSGAAFAPALRG